MHLSRLRLEHLDHCNPHIDSPFGINTLYQIYATLSLRQGYQSTGAVLIQDRTNFPIPEPLAGLDHCGPILNGSGIGNYRTLAVHSLSVTLAPLAKALVKLPTSGLVSSHIPIDPLMTDGHANPVAHTTDLFRAPR